MRRILFWLFLPFVLPQGVLLRRNAPRFAGAKGLNQGSVGAGKTLKLIAVGDSIISGVGVEFLQQALAGTASTEIARQFNCSVSWLALGSIGATSNKVLHTLIPKLPTEAADIFILSVGVNDITSLKRSGTWKANLRKLLLALQRHSPQAVIALAGIPPLKGFPLLPQPLRALFGMRGKTFDLIARQEALQHPNVVYVPLEFDPLPEKFSPDGYHPSEESYQEFGVAVAQEVVRKNRPPLTAIA